MSLGVNVRAVSCMLTDFQDFNIGYTFIKRK